ncbi:MAG: MgtC/SapB family protein [Actinomycetota bacterium]|nr:MgtC/SapB family protein [Actinomycetota bacterium]
MTDSFLNSLGKEFSFSIIPFLLDFFIPCLLAIVFGGIIGFQRERADRPAGLRTHSLVCLGSTVFTLISYFGFLSFTNIDHSRIAAGIITGIGFIGAGAIFRRGPLVKGVTTAASIWIVAAVGMALGAKLYYLALMVTIFGYIILTLIKYFEDRYISSPIYAIKITADVSLPGTEEIQKIVKSYSDKVDIRVFKVGVSAEDYQILLNAQSRDYQLFS